MKTCIFAGLLAISTSIFPAIATPIRAEEPNNLKFIPQNDPDMAAAAAKAQSGVDDFLAKLDSPPAGTENYSVKIGIVDDGDSYALTGLRNVENVEYFWLGNIQRTADGFSGLLGNEPGVARNVRAGQEIAFTKGDIFDWMYVKDRKIVGNVTACPLLLRGPKEELEFYRQNYGLEC